MKRNIAFPGSSWSLILIMAVGFLLVEIAELLIKPIPRGVNDLNILLVDGLIPTIIIAPFMWWLLKSRDRFEKALKESEERFRTIFEGSPDAIFLADPETGIIIDANSRASELTARPHEEIIGMHQAQLHPPRNNEYSRVTFKEHARKTKQQEDIHPFENFVLRPDGTEVPVEVLAQMVTIKGRPVLQGVFRDITERKRVEERIEASLKEKEMLLREIHHRVKNNMQVISSLLWLQSGYIKDKKYLEMFRDSQNRIMSMSLIHEKLYRSKDLAKIEFNEYIRDLVNGLFQSHGVKTGTIALNINVDKVSLGILQAIPCGLLINELITNSLKYAFPEDKKGEIRVSIHLNNENMVELTVSDNGVGIPSDVDFRKTESLGLRLVTILAEDQLQGKIDLDRTRGTEFIIKFKGGY